MLKGDSVPNVSWTYAEGRYFDLWMFVHTLTGVVIGLSAYMLGIGPLIAYTGTFVGLALYELVEEYFGVNETLENRLGDIVFGYIGFAVLYAFVAPHVLLGTNQLLLVAAGILVMVGAVVGWRAYEKRSGLSE